MTQTVPDVPAPSDTAPAAPPAARPRSRLRRRARRLAVVAVLAGLLFLFRAPLLRSLAGVLVVDEPPQPADALLLLHADRREARAAELFHAGLAPRILLIEGAPRRLVALGVIPSDAAVVRGELVRRGVPDDALTVLPEPASNDWSRARVLAGWLAGHPEARLTVLCSRFMTRRTRHVFAAVLGDEAAGRLRWCGQPHRRYDETNWWQGKEGVLDFFGAATRLGHVWVAGEGTRGRRAWDPDEYEKSLP